MSGAFTFHHVGVAVPDLEQAATFYSEAFGFRVVSGPFEDPIQKVKVCFMAEAGRSLAHLELISPLDSDSPVNGYLTKGIGAYHVCYEVAEIAKALAELRGKGCLVISRPVPAVAFAGRKIAWCFTPTHQLLELLQQDTPDAS
jgi:methylmalonyl-CoA/ethylmalonyl-CoA epimerase